MQLTKIGQSTFDVKDNTGISWIKRIDLNKDGLQDFVFYANSLRSWSYNPKIAPVSYLKIFLQQPSGNLIESTESFINNKSPIMGSDLSLANLNQDGVIDFVLAGSGWDPYSNGMPAYNTALSYGEPDLLFISKGSKWEATETGGATVFTHNVGVGDINSDGKDDVFSSSILSGFENKTQDRSFISISNSNGGFDYNQTKLPGLLTNQDIYFNFSNRVSYIDSSGNSIVTGSKFTGAIIFDANRDGYNDLAVFSDEYTKNGIIFLNDKSGGFSDKNSIALPAGSYGSGGFNSKGEGKGTIELEGEAADIDGDGDFDLAVLETNSNGRDGKSEYYNGSTIQVLKNDSNGNFTIAQEITLLPTSAPNYSYYYDIEFYDVNNDGRSDLIAYGKFSNKDYYSTEIYLNSDQSFIRATEQYIPEKGALYVPYNQNQKTHFLKYDTSAYAIDSRDGVALSNATFTNFQSSIDSGKIIAGSATTENIIGSEGQDIFLWSGGNDILDGLGGTDTFKTSQKSSDIKLDKSNDYFVYKFGSQNITLYNFERLQFSDKTIALDINSNAGQAYRLYQAAFARTPDNDGLKYWISKVDAGVDLKTVAAAFQVSAEFQSKYGANPTSDQLITAMYQNVLKRAPDQAGNEYWKAQLSNGAVTKDSLLVNFSESNENQVNVIGVIQNGIELM